MSECWQHCKMSPKENYTDKHNLQWHHQGECPSSSLKTFQHVPFALAGKTCWGICKADCVCEGSSREVLCSGDRKLPHFSGLGHSVSEMCVQNSFSRYHWWLPPCTLLQLSHSPHFLNSLHHLPPSLARTTLQWATTYSECRFPFHVPKTRSLG